MEPFKFSYKTEKEDAIMVNIHRSGYQKCSAGYQMGPLSRSVYLIHHVVSGKGYYLWRTLPDAGAGGQKGGLCRETAADAGYHKEKAWDYSARESGQGPERL